MIQWVSCVQKKEGGEMVLSWRTRTGAVYIPVLPSQMPGEKKQ